MSDSVAALRQSLAGRYAIDRELGAGGMATVYLAHDVKHDRDVAIKVLHPDLGAALGGERFLSEIRTTARLQHPHILPLLDSGDAGGLLYYVMPVVTGETLRARLTREKQLPIPEAVRIAREVASALDYAHRQGVIHRDIKPENILLHDGQALVADFGIALAVQTAGGARMTQTGLSLGTPQYMSPEQAMGERAIDARSDVYALGAVTYEMLAGDAPFTGSSVQAIVAKVLAERPTPIRTTRDTVPPNVEHAVLTALAKLPADRYATAAEFAAALSSTGATFAVPVQPVLGRNRPALAFAAVAVVAIAVAAWGWLRPQATPPVVRHRISLDSVPETHDWGGRLAISPDGAVIVHSGGVGGRLLVHRRDQLGFTALPSTEGGRAPFFSPDGRLLAFVLGNKLMVAPLDGGPPVIYADSMDSQITPAWGADGYFYGVKRLNAEPFAGILRVAATPGASVEPVTRVDSAGKELFHSRTEPLPRGDKLIFSITYRDGRDAIAVGDVHTGAYTVIASGVRARYAADGHLVYTTRDGKLWSVPFSERTLKVSGTPTLVSEHLRSTIIGPADFAISRTGTLAYVTDDAFDRRELAWVSRDGTAHAVDSAWRGSFVAPVVSPDGRQLAVGMRTGNSADIWTNRVEGNAPAKVTFGTTPSVSPAWTPDGRALTYISGATSTGDVFIQKLDGTQGATRLLKSPRAISEATWSPVGGWLLVRTTTPTMGSGDILAFRPPGDTIPVPVVATPFAEYSPTVSPDGKWMAYASNVTGPFEIYVVPFPNPGTAKWQLSTHGGTSPRWSHGGNEIFYLDGEANLVAAQVTTTPTFAKGRQSVLTSAIDYANEGPSRRNYDVTPDDQRFLMIRRARGSGSSQIVVVENWFEELKQRAGGAR